MSRCPGHAEIGSSPHVDWNPKAIRSIWQPSVTSVVQRTSARADVQMLQVGLSAMVQRSTASQISDEVPWSADITAYDEAHLTLYLRLLDASADGASVEEMAQTILEIDPAGEPERAKKCVASHLRRARWMSDKGYRRLAGQ